MVENHQERSPFYENGLPRFKGDYLEGEMHGPWEFFRKDGSLMRSGEFNREPKSESGEPMTEPET